MFSLINIPLSVEEEVALDNLLDFQAMSKLSNADRDNYVTSSLYRYTHVDDLIDEVANHVTFLNMLAKNYPID